MMKMRVLSDKMYFLRWNIHESDKWIFYNEVRLALFDKE